MNTHVILAAAAVVAALAGSARAERNIALDYHSKVKGCPTADRFADEVAAKVGFVPWDPQATSAIRVRITSDGGEVVGTIEQPDGASKVLRAATCAKLDEALVSAIAVAIDRTTAAIKTANAVPRDDERRLKRFDREPADGLVTVELRGKDGRELEVSRVKSQSFVYGAQGTAAIISLERVCKALPCTAKLPVGTSTLLFRDVVNRASASSEADLKVSSTLELDYVSRLDTRRATMRRAKWGALIGTLAGAAATAYLIQTGVPADEHRGLSHALFDPLGAVVGMGIGAIVARFTGPGLPGDEAHVTVRPGLGFTSGL